MLDPSIIIQFSSFICVELFLCIKFWCWKIDVMIATVMAIIDPNFCTYTCDLNVDLSIYFIALFSVK